MRHATETTAIDVEITREGNKLVGRDVFPGGDRSCIKQNLGTYQSPEHAEIMGAILSDIRLKVLAASGQITQEKMDLMAAELRRLRTTGGTSTQPAATT